MKKISVTIATYKRHEFLKLMLNSLANQSLEKSQYEILICDSHSGWETDNAVTEISEEHPELNIRHIHTANILAAKRNLGIREAKHEIVIFLDDDCLMEKDFLEKHKKHFDADNKKCEEKLIICGEVRFPKEWASHSNYYRFRDEEGFYFDETPNLNLDYRTIIVMNMSFMKDVFIQNIHNVNENFVGYGMEDQELGWRLEKAGFKIIGSDARVYHHEMSKNIEGYGKKIFHTARDGAATLLKECPDAFKNIKVLKIIDPDFPHESKFHSCLYKFIRYVIFNKLFFSIFLKWVNLTDRISFLYSKKAYRYILANYYIAGATQRGIGKPTEGNWYT